MSLEGLERECYKMSCEIDNLVAEVESLKKEKDILTLENCKGSSVLDDYRSEVERLKEEVEAYKLKEKICSDCECHPEYLRWKRENEQLKEDVEGWKKAYTDMHDAQLNSVKVIREWEKENKQLKEALEIKTEHVEQCINNLDKFKKEIEQLKDDLYHEQECNTGLCTVVSSLESENKQLKEALKKCSPMTSVIESQTVKGFTVKCCYDCEATQEDSHEPNCEYIRLIGGDGE